jgi:hypothetical protein
MSLDAIGSSPAVAQPEDQPPKVAEDFNKPYRILGYSLLAIAILSAIPLGIFDDSLASIGPYAVLGAGALLGSIAAGGVYFSFCHRAPKPNHLKDKVSDDYLWERRKKFMKIGAATLLVLLGIGATFAAFYHNNFISWGSNHIDKMALIGFEAGILLTGSLFFIFSPAFINRYINREEAAKDEAQFKPPADLSKIDPEAVPSVTERGFDPSALET